MESTPRLAAKITFASDELALCPTVAERFAVTSSAISLQRRSAIDGRIGCTRSVE